MNEEIEDQTMEAESPPHEWPVVVSFGGGTPKSAVCCWRRLWKSKRRNRLVGKS